MPSTSSPFASPSSAPVRTPLSAVGTRVAAPTTDLLALLQMPFPAFARTVADLLGRIGYTEVEVVKALHGRGKGRNQHGGYDLQMRLPYQRADNQRMEDQLPEDRHSSGLLTGWLAIAQVKQYKEPVPRGFVDELRGAMLRVGATQGLLVTTGTFSQSAIEAAQAGQYAAPVRLLGGEELVRLLRAHPAPRVRHAVPVFFPSAPPSPNEAAARRAQKAEADHREREFLESLSADAGRTGNPPVPPVCSQAGDADRRREDRGHEDSRNHLAVRVTVNVCLLAPHDTAPSPHSAAPLRVESHEQEKDC